MKELANILTLPNFLNEDYNNQREQTIEAILRQVKEKYGDPDRNTMKFLGNVREDGLKDFKEYISELVDEKMDEVEGDVDFSSTIRGLIAWIVFEQEIKRNKEKEN